MYFYLNIFNSQTLFIQDASQKLGFWEWFWASWWYRIFMGIPGGSDSKESTCNAEDLGLIPGLRRSPVEGNLQATHSSVLAWRIPWTKEPSKLQSMGSQRVRHDWQNFTFTFCARGKDLISNIFQFHFCKCYHHLWNICDIYKIFSKYYLHICILQVCLSTIFKQVWVNSILRQHLGRFYLLPLKVMHD